MPDSYNDYRNQRRYSPQRRYSRSPDRNRRRSRSRSPYRNSRDDYRQSGSGFTSVPPSYGQPSKIPVYNGHRLHLSNLNMNVSKTHLEDIFSQYGELHEVYVARQRPCFAFVNFKRKEDAEEAQYKCDGINIGGNKIIVNYAKERQKIGGKFVTPKSEYSDHNSSKRSPPSYRSHHRSEHDHRDRYGSSSPRRNDRYDGYSKQRSPPSRRDDYRNERFDRHTNDRRSRSKSKSNSRSSQNEICFV